MKPRIRVKSLCVFGYEGRILAALGVDEVKGERFYRPLGGAVEFGETAANALRREIREELQEEIDEPVLLGVLESRFTFAGQPGHEIVFVFDARFVNPRLYSQSLVPFIEAACSGEAEWINPQEPPRYPLYPEGLTRLLERQEGR